MPAGLQAQAEFPYITSIASDGHLPTEDTDHLRTVALRTLLNKATSEPT